MFYPIGFGGHHFLLYLVVPAILGIWAQIRVTGAFNRWGKVRASANITGAKCAREILQAAQIHDVDVVETNDFPGRPLRSNEEEALPFQQCLQHAISRRTWDRGAR